MGAQDWWAGCGGSHVPSFPMARGSGEKGGSWLTKHCWTKCSPLPRRRKISQKEESWHFSGGRTMKNMDIIENVLFWVQAFSLTLDWEMPCWSSAAMLQTGVEADCVSGRGEEPNFYKIYPRTLTKTKPKWYFLIKTFPELYWARFEGAGTENTDFSRRQPKHTSVIP